MADTVSFLYETDTATLVFSRCVDQWVEDIKGLSSVDAQVSESQGVGQIGATPTAATMLPKTLTITGAVRDASARAVLLAAVLPGVPARLTMIGGDTRRYVEGIPTKSPDLQNTVGAQRFQIGFRCSNPMWRGEDTATGLAGLQKLFQFPRSFSGRWYISRYTVNAFATVTNPGNAPCDMTVRFVARAPVTNPALYHLQSDSWIKLNTTLDTGCTIEVCTVYGRKGAVLLSGKDQEQTTSNAFRLLDIESNLGMQLLPGDNTFKFDASSGKESLDVTILAPKGVWAGV